MSSEIDTLSLCLQTPKCLPALFWGVFGIGKTSRVLDLTSALGWDCEMIRPAERGEGALGVVPVPSEDRQVLHYPLPDWAQRFMESDRPALVFLDEVSSTPPALQPAIMGLALDGIIAGQRLPAHVRRCAAANPIEQAAGGWELAPSLANRFVHLDWPAPKVGEWVDWLSGQNGYAGGVKLDLDKWEIEWGMAKALGAAFLRRFPSALCEDMEKAVGRTPPAYATPRTWECALRLLASCRAAKKMELYPALAQGALGPTVAMQGSSGDPAGAWLVWLKDADLPDPEELLADPELLQHDPRRPDRTFATLYAVAEAGLCGISGRKTTEKARLDRWQRAWAVLDKALGLKLGKDIVLLPAKQLANRHRRPRGEAGPAGHRVCEVLGEFIDLYTTE